jgi:hypothetical protein
VAGEREPISDEPPLIECDLPLGRPGLVVHDSLVLSGWAASPKGIAGIAVQIGERQWNAAYGLDTPAVADRLPAVDGSGRAGFHLPLTTSGWEPGSHFVTVAAFDNAGGRTAVEGAVEVRPFGDESPQDGGTAHGAGDVILELDLPLSPDGPIEVEGPPTITGWAHASEGIEAVLVTVDDTLQYEALRPIVRPDLLATLGREDAATAGFSLRLDPSDFPPGTHTLTVAALTRDGRVAGVAGEVVSRSPLAPRLDAVAIDWMAERVAPRLREPGAEPTDAERMWESRALAAEADAAHARAQALLARGEQERAWRLLRAVEDDSGVLIGRLRGELTAARQSLAALRQELDAPARPSS